MSEKNDADNSTLNNNNNPSDNFIRIDQNQLTAMMLAGQSNLVVKYLRLLPKDESVKTKTRLKKNLEQINKNSNRRSTAHNPSNNPSNPSSNPSNNLANNIASNPSNPASNISNNNNNNHNHNNNNAVKAGDSIPEDVPQRSAHSHPHQSRLKKKRTVKTTESVTDDDQPEVGESSGKDTSRSPELSSAGVNITERFVMYNEIGRGMFGVVYRGEDTEQNMPVAIKEIEIDVIDATKIPNLKREATVLEQLAHPNIVKLYAFLTNIRKKFYFILEYMDRGSLYSVIKRFGVLPEDLTGLYIRETLKGLKYIHEKGFIHRDIKSANLLLNSHGEIKLADFGTAKLEDTNKNFTVVGTPYWMAPEIIEMTSVTTTSDIWSLGCTLIELLTGTPPYFELVTMTALFNIVEDPHPPIPNNLSKTLKHFLLTGCFVKDHQARLTAKALLGHPFIENVKEIPIPGYEEAINKICEFHGKKPETMKSTENINPPKSDPTKQNNFSLFLTPPDSSSVNNSDTEGDAPEHSDTNYASPLSEKHISPRRINGSGKPPIQSRNISSIANHHKHRRKNSAGTGDPSIITVTSKFANPGGISKTSRNRTLPFNNNNNSSNNNNHNSNHVFSAELTPFMNISLEQLQSELEEIKKERDNLYLLNQELKGKIEQVIKERDALKLQLEKK